MWIQELFFVEVRYYIYDYCQCSFNSFSFYFVQRVKEVIDQIWVVFMLQGVLVGEFVIVLEVHESMSYGDLGLLWR